MDVNKNIIFVDGEKFNQITNSGGSKEENLMTDQEWFEKYYMPGQKQYIRKKIRSMWFKGILLGLCCGVVLGYAWHYKQVTEPHKKEIAEWSMKYLETRDKLGDLEAKLGIAQGRVKIGKIDKKEAK